MSGYFIFLQRFDRVFYIKIQDKRILRVFGTFLIHHNTCLRLKLADKEYHFMKKTLRFILKAIFIYLSAYLGDVIYPVFAALLLICFTRVLYSSSAPDLDLSSFLLWIKFHLLSVIYGLRFVVADVV